MKTRYLIALSAVLLAVVGATIAYSQPQPKPAPARTVAPLQPGVLTALPLVEPAPARAAAPPQPGVPPAPPLPAHAPPAPESHEIPAVAPGGKTSPKPEDLTIDQLLEAVDGFREQKAELEKKEKAYLKALYRKAEKQKERIDGLGGDGQPVPALVPGPVAPGLPTGVPPAPGLPTVIPPGLGSIVPTNRW